MSKLTHGLILTLLIGCAAALWFAIPVPLAYLLISVVMVMSWSSMISNITKKDKNGSNGERS